MSSRSTIRLTCLAGFAVGSALACGTANAEELRWDYAKSYGAVAVTERSRREFLSDGIRIGNFILRPEVGYGVTWSRNNAQGLDLKISDFRHEINTRLELQSATPRHMLTILAQGRGVQYQHSDEIHYVDGSIGSNWRIDIDHATSIFGGASYAVRHLENVDDENPRGASRPGRTTSYGAELGIRRQGHHIDAELGVRYQHFEFSDIPANDGSLIRLGWQDYSYVRPAATLAWRPSPGYRVFGEIAGSFQQNVGNSVIDRDATGMEASVGVQFELTPLVRVMLKGGFAQQDYHQANLVDIAEPVWEGRLEWLITPLVTMNLATWRTIRATQYGIASGQIVTGHSLKFDYEMWRNLVVSLEGSLRDLDYVGESRNDRVVTAGIGFDYLYSKHWQLGARYEHQELVSSIDTYNTSLDRVKFNVTYRF
ncbi:MAG: outer membrane beta-barrel protein [Hyphomicrobiaceae bacterium]